MKKDSTIGVVREGDGLSWARASRARPGEPAACGAGAPPGRSEGLTLSLSTSDVLFKALLVPTANPEEVAVIVLAPAASEPIAAAIAECSLSTGMNSVSTSPLAIYVDTICGISVDGVIGNAGITSGFTWRIA